MKYTHDGMLESDQPRLDPVLSEAEFKKLTQHPHFKDILHLLKNSAEQAEELRGNAFMEQIRDSGNFHLLEVDPDMVDPELLPNVAKETDLEQSVSALARVFDFYQQLKDGKIGVMEAPIHFGSDALIDTPPLVPFNHIRHCRPVEHLQKTETAKHVLGAPAYFNREQHAQLGAMTIHDRLFYTSMGGASLFNKDTIHNALDVVKETLASNHLSKSENGVMLAQNLQEIVDFMQSDTIRPLMQSQPATTNKSRFSDN